MGVLLLSGPFEASRGLENSTVKLRSSSMLSLPGESIAAVVGVAEGDGKQSWFGGTVMSVSLKSSLIEDPMGVVRLLEFKVNRPSVN